MEAKSVTEPESGRYVFDMGQNMVGWVRLKVRGRPGPKSPCAHAEALNPDGTIYTTNLRSARPTDHTCSRGRAKKSTSRASPSTASATSRSRAIPASPGSTSSPAASSTPHAAHRHLRMLERAGQPAAEEHRLGPARQLPRRPHRLPAARRAPRVDRRRAGLHPHRRVQHGRRRLLREVADRRRGRAVR